MNPELTKLQQLKYVLPVQLAPLVPSKMPNEISFSALNINNAEQAANFIKAKTFLSLLQKPQIVQPEPIATEQPIILVFCQPSQQLAIDGDKIYPYVPIAYCSWIEGAGAKCIPLPYNLNQGSIEFLLERSHGLLIPGGGSNLYKNYHRKEGYGPVTIGFQKIWRFIQKMWNKGVHYPVWGTCLGLQIVLMAISNDVKVLSNLNSRMHQLQIYSQYNNSIFLKNIPINLRLNMENKKLMNFQHAHGITINKFHQYPRLTEKLKITQISKDKDGKWFCSGLEGKDQPIFLSQYHPQKQAYQWSKNGDILHNKSSIDISQHIAASFVSQCRKCKPNSSFVDSSQLMFNVIQQYKHIHTPQKMYKIFAIDFKYRDRQSKNLRKDVQRGRSRAVSVKQPFI